jgi:NTP pyrophosphatase (non-canonical NTP hydrolase)
MTTSDLTFRQLAEANAARHSRWHPPESEPWSLADWSNAMCGEAGEAANMVKKLRRIETGTDRGPWSIPHSTVPGRMVHLDRGQQARILAKGIGLELADVVIYADLLAQQLTRRYGGYPLDELVVTKFNAVSHREGFPEHLTPPRVPQVGDVLR